MSTLQLAQVALVLGSTAVAIGLGGLALALVGWLFERRLRSGARVRVMALGAPRTSSASAELGEVRAFPGTPHEALEWACAKQDAETVVVLVKDSEGSWEISFSLMSHEELAYVHRLFGYAVDREIGVDGD